MMSRPFRPDPAMSAEQLVRSAVDCLIAALDAERVMDPLRMNIVYRFMTGTTPAEQEIVLRPPDRFLWTPEQQEAAADALLAALAEHMGVDEAEALRQIGEHWSRPRITDAFVCRPDCPRCLGSGHVCEAHPDRPWENEAGTCCGAPGMPCNPDLRGDPSTWPPSTPSTPTP